MISPKSARNTAKQSSLSDFGILPFRKLRSKNQRNRGSDILSIGWLPLLFHFLMPGGMLCTVRRNA